MLNRLNNILGIRILLPCIASITICMCIYDVYYRECLKDINRSIITHTEYNARIRFLEQKFLERKAYSILDVE